MSKEQLLIEAGTVILELAKSKKMRKIVLGEYSDGSPRSIVDAMEGEIYSPKQKKKALKKKKKKKKKKNYLFE